MDRRLKAIIATAFFLVICAWTGAVLQRPEAKAAQLNPTPRKIASCEKIIANAIMYPADKDYAENAGRFAAVQVTDCEDHGLLSPTNKATLMRSKLKTFIMTYQADRDVWR